MTNQPVRERPILFSGAMALSILEDRKSKTRRVMQPQPPDWIKEFGYTAFTPKGHISGRGTYQDQGPAEKFFKSPYGLTGDRLWAREQLIRPDGDPWLYAADRQPVMVSKEDETAMLVWAHHKDRDYCPSIHMPRWASRITLELTNLRVERVRDISEGDAKTEGIWAKYQPAVVNSKGLELCPGGDVFYYGEAHSPRGGFDTAVQCFKNLWDSINAKRPGCSWNANPFCWVLSFRRVQQERAAA